MTEERKTHSYSKRSRLCVKRKRKKVSLKIKLTLLYTIFYSCGCRNGSWNIVFFEVDVEILASTKMSLERRVEESLEEIEMQDGELKIDSDFYSVENGVHLSMYDSTGYFYMERFPGIRSAAGLLDGEVREIKDKAGEEDWYIYDLFSEREKVRRYMYAGISVTESERVFRRYFRIAFILLPLRLPQLTAFVDIASQKERLSL